VRDDLVALTPESVAALANLGLVKRAQREIEQGKGPALAEEADGTVVGTFEEGAPSSRVVARLVPRRALRDCPCTCGAPTVCRHRVAVALAYRAWIAASVPAAAAAPIEPWSPGEIDEEALAQRLGRRVMDEARSIRRRGVVVDVRRPRGEDPAPAAMLPACTVRFLVPRDLAYARCDCREGLGCAHVAIAVWAFREADARDAARDAMTVDVREHGASVEAGALDSAVELASSLLVDGVASSREALAQRFAIARAHLAEEGDVWPSTLLEEIEELLALYRARSARYRASEVARRIAEIEARRRAARGGGELPARFVLGRGEALETRLDHVRLVSLGARLDGDERTREVRVLLADPDTGAVLVLAKEWTFADGETVPEAPELGRRRLAGGASLHALAGGQLVTKVALRRANRALRLGSSAMGTTSVTPQTGEWEALPAGLTVARIASLAESLAARPPRMLRPRVLAEDVHAIAIGSVEHVAWDPARQTLIATALDREGMPFRIVRAYRAMAPKAVDAIAGALLGQWGVPRYVAGEVVRRLGAIEIDPTSIACDRVVVPDLEPDPPRRELPLGRLPEVASALERALAAADGALEEAAHLGLRHVPQSWPDRAHASAKALAQLGLADLGASCANAADALRAARRAPDDASWKAAASAWLAAGIGMQLALELA
jgi:hypothetical protein